MIRLHPRLDALEASLIRKVFAAAPPGSLNMGLGMPDLPVAACVRAAVRAELDAGMAPYSPNAGWLSLREAVAEMYTRWADEGAQVGRWIEGEGVVVTAGVEEGLFCALTALCGAGDEVLVPDPGFPAYGMIATVIGATTATYCCGAGQGFRPTAEAIESSLTPRTRAVIINAPGNPTGTLAEPEELRRICALLDERRIPWVSDEIYDRFVYTSQPFCSPSNFSRKGIVLSGLSKSANMMGWRLGWLAAPVEAVAGLTAVHQSVCTCASTLAQAAALAVVEGLCGRGPALDVVERNVEVFGDRRRRALAALDALGLRRAPAEGAFYAFVDVRPHLREGEDDLALCMRMLEEQRVIAIPGQGFGEAGRGWVRLAYTTARVEDGVRRFGEALGLR